MMIFFAVLLGLLSIPVAAVARACVIVAGRQAEEGDAVKANTGFGVAAAFGLLAAVMLAASVALVLEGPCSR
jgi:hypothetical protein